MANPSNASKPTVPAGLLQITCSCGTNLAVKSEHAGKQVRCSKCQAVLVVPEASTAAHIPSHTLDTRGGDDSLPSNASQSSTWSFLAPAQAKDEIGRLGPYRVLQVLGAGGMGVVFKAEDPALKRQVALKAMLPSATQSPGAKARFLREAHTAAALKHGHIDCIYQVGEDRDVPYLAMEFLKGESLEDRLKREGRLSIAEVLRIGAEVADGLSAAHEEGLIHRDIKPANVWMEARGGRRKDGASAADRSPARAKILEVGLASRIPIGTHSFATSTVA